MKRTKLLLTGALLAVPVLGHTASPKPEYSLESLIQSVQHKYELEVCTFVGPVPPGVDEPLNCDQKCFLEELGKNIVKSHIASLHQLYSVGWRLIELTKAKHNDGLLWHVYIEREKTRTNECDRVHAPKKDRKLID